MGTREAGAVLLILVLSASMLSAQNCESFGSEAETSETNRIANRRFLIYPVADNNLEGCR